MDDAVPGQSAERPEGAAQGPSAPAVVRASSLERNPLRYFPNFLYRVWRELGYERPTPIQYDMAEWLATGPSKLVNMAFRGAAKSYVTVPYCVHALYCDPREHVFSVSATAKFAGTNAQFAYMMISQFEWLQHMIPRTDQRRSALGFDVRDAPAAKFESFWADSIFGQITGRRGSLIMCDDIEIPKTSDTDTSRDQLRKAYGELSGACMLPGGRIRILGTAQNEQSLYPELATQKGYGMRMWPILYPSPQDTPRYGPWLAPMLLKRLQENPSLVGTSTEPSRFSEADIAEREMEWGRTEFDRQFRLFMDAGAGGATPLRLRDLICLEWGPPPPRAPGQDGYTLKLPPETRWGPLKENTVQGVPFDALPGDTLQGPSYVTPPSDWRPVETLKAYIDPSGKGKDETTVTIGAQLAGMIFVCAQTAFLEGHSEATLDGIAKVLRLWGCQDVIVESNFGGEMFGTLLTAALQKAQWPCIIDYDRKGTQSKELRVVTSLEPPISGHRVVINLAMLKGDYAVDYDEVADAKRRFYRLTYQLTRITKNKGSVNHDDRVDGLASLVKRFQDVLRQQTEDALKANRDAQMDLEIERQQEALLAQQGALMGAQQGPAMKDRFGHTRHGPTGSLVFGRRSPNRRR